MIEIVRNMNIINGKRFYVVYRTSPTKSMPEWIGRLIIRSNENTYAFHADIKQYSAEELSAIWKYLFKINSKVNK